MNVADDLAPRGVAAIALAAAERGRVRSRAPSPRLLPLEDVAAHAAAHVTSTPLREGRAAPA